MDKNTDSQEKKNGRATRRRPDGKSAFSKFEWGSVDDQAQEDMIEPTPTVKRKRARQPHKRDKDVGTMYVSPSSDSPEIKKKRVAAPRAEDYAGFVAEVDEGEEDAFATPSYGRTKLTHNDEVLVEELSTTREKKEKRPKERVERAAGSDPDASDRPKREKKPARRKGEEAEEAPEAKEKEENKSTGARKRSFLSKIKEAISTGAVAPEVETAKAASVQAKGGAQGVSAEKMRQLAQNVSRAASIAGVEFDEATVAGAGSQLDALVDMMDALIRSNLALIERVSNGAQAEKRASEPRKPIRKAEEIFDVETDVAQEKAEEAAPAPRVKEPREKKPRREQSEQKTVEVARTVENDLDDYDPIAAWENMPDDDEEAPRPAASKTRERGSKLIDETDDDFDDWDEAGSKKKSARVRQDAQDEPLLEAAPSTVKSRSRGARKSAAKSESASEPGSGAKKAKRDKVARDEKEESRPLERFGELKLEKATLKALGQMGYSEPTPIQAGTIPRIQAGVDVMGQARTGTGKTAAFMIPIVEGVDACEPGDAPLALAVVPTRELAVQVRDETIRLAKYRDLNVVACYGGKPIASQVEKIRKGVDILVGTPGRIIDLTNRGVLSLRSARWVVLDEADRMLDIGFRPDVEKILRQTPSSRQTLLFSATLAPPVVRLAKAYMKDPEQFDFSQKDVSAETIEQFYLTVDKDRKYDALVRLLETQEPRQAIVFCRTKRCVDGLGRRLQAQFKNVEAIHGDLPQTKRDRIMSDFRAEKTKILVATDIVGRGIDVSTVSHIVNYDIPQYCDDYVHRVGRAGRMGREGVAFTLVTAEEGSELTRIEIRIDRLLKRVELPGFEAYSRPAENSDAGGEPDRIERKPVFGQTRRRFSRAL